MIGLMNIFLSALHLSLFLQIAFLHTGLLRMSMRILQMHLRE